MLITLQEGVKVYALGMILINPMLITQLFDVYKYAQQILITTRMTQQLHVSLSVQMEQFLEPLQITQQEYAKRSAIFHFSIILTIQQETA